MSYLFKIGIILLFGIVGGRLAKIFKLPNVSGYLVAGLFLGPTFINLISPEDMLSFSPINELALSAIAFSIGNEFVFKNLKKLGKSVFIITLAEVVGAITLVFVSMFFILKQDFAFSIVIASMSAATAPAATLLVIQQYKAYGPLTKTILPVVALDDIFGIIAFGIAISLAKLSVGSQDTGIAEMIFAPLIEIFGSIALGLALGFLLTFFAKKAKGRDEIQALTLMTLLIATGLSQKLGLSPLLTSIIIGTILVNMLQSSKRVFNSINDLISPIYILFFTLAGSSLDLKVLMSVGLLGLAYVISRAAGKMFGAWSSAKALKSEPAITKYLGLALLPQGGISIGLLVLVSQQLQQYYAHISTIIMFSVLIYEVSGPIFAKIAIQKADEINGLEKLESKA